MIKAWIRVVGQKRLKKALSGEGKPITYCVKFSEFCKCESCMAEREVQADIVPRRNQESISKDSTGSQEDIINKYILECQDLIAH